MENLFGCDLPFIKKQNENKYYSYCLIDNNGKIIIQDIDVTPKNKMIEILTNVNKQFIKVVRTAEPLNVVLNSLNQQDINLFNQLSLSDLFKISHPYLVDVTKEFK